MISKAIFHFSFKYQCEKQLFLSIKIRGLLKRAIRLYFSILSHNISIATEKQYLPIISSNPASLASANQSLCSANNPPRKYLLSTVQQLIVF